MKCNTCNGKRVIVRTVANVQRSNGVDYRSSRPATVDRLYQCERCNGSGHEPDPTPVVVCGGTVEAPGFDSRTFADALHRATARGYFHIRPSRPGTVTVDTGRAAAYVVTRTGCSCPGHASHGRCLHRAAAIYTNDVCGIDLCSTEILGFANGQPVTAGDALQEVA